MNPASNTRFGSGVISKLDKTGCPPFRPWPDPAGPLNITLKVNGKEAAKGQAPVGAFNGTIGKSTVKHLK
jgi:hypothetical protein